MDNPFISIIVPVYNKSQYLPYFFECCNQIDSKLDIEIVFIDDGSTDNSWELLEQYQTKNSSAKCYRQKNEGAGYARNLGINKARGAFLSFIDSDDLFNAESLSRIIQKLKSTNADILFLKFKNINEENSFDTYYQSDYEFDYLLCTSPAPWGRCFKTEFIINNGIHFNHARTGEDMYFNCLAQSYNPHNEYLDEVFIYYRTTENSLSTTINKKPLAIFESFCSLIEILNNRELYSVYTQKCLSRYCFKYLIDDFGKVNYSNKKVLMEAYKSMFELFDNNDISQSTLYGKRYIFLHNYMIKGKCLIPILYLKLVSVKEVLKSFLN